MTDASDPGLTDLIAAALYAAIAKAAPSGSVSVADMTASVLPVVERHTNGRMAELEARVDEWSAEYRKGIRARDNWRARAEKAEATIARMIAALEASEKSVPDDWGVTYIYTSQFRAALEGKS